jgi:3-deoxy-D-manno-octulosonic-acid transferase
MSHPFYTVAFGTLLGLYAPVAVTRRLVRGIPLNVRARLARGAPPPAGGPRGWIHAVSVGEAIAAAPLLEGLHAAHPALPLVVTTVTETGARIVRERFAGLAEHRYFPLDLPGAAARAVRSLDPAFLICLETELWPNVLRHLAARSTPVMIANGRFSDRSFRRYRLVRPFMRRVLADVTVLAMQSEDDARRAVALGAPPARVFVTGNLKREARVDGAEAADRWRARLGLAPGRLLWIAGSTHPGEEDAVFQVHAAARRACPDLALVVAPRHPERAADVLARARAAGAVAVRRTALPATADVVVLDTVGELAELYGAADVVFVGGSLVPHGGQNLLEPALRGKPVLFGPHTQNFREATALLTASGGGAVVADAPDLAAALGALLADPARRRRMGEAARAAAAPRDGAVAATLDLVERFLYPRPPAAGRRVATGP